MNDEKHEFQNVTNISRSKLYKILNLNKSQDDPSRKFEISLGWNKSSYAEGQGNSRPKGRVETPQAQGWSESAKVKELS